MTMNAVFISEPYVQRLYALALAQETEPESVLTDLIERAFRAPDQSGIPTIFPWTSHTTAPTAEVAQQFSPPS